MSPDEIDSLRAENVAMRELLWKAYRHELTDTELHIILMRSAQRYAAYTIVERLRLQRLAQKAALLDSILVKLDSIKQLCTDAYTTQTTIESIQRDGP